MARWAINCKKVIYFLCLPIAFLMTACSHLGDRVLESKDVADFKVVETTPQPSPILKLSGISIHSALGISGMELKIEGDSLTILMYLARIREGLSGFLDQEIIVPDGVNIVRFGKLGDILWKRGEGVIPRVTGTPLYPFNLPTGPRP